MVKLIEREILELNQSLSEFRKLNILDLIKKVDEIKEWSESAKKSRKVLLKSFFKFASKKNNIKPSKIVIPFAEFRNFQKFAISELLSSNEIKAKSSLLTDKNIIQFLIELCKINPRDCLICWMMWEFKCTIHQVLDIKIKDIDISKDIIYLKDTILLSPKNGIREDLKKCILWQIKEKNDFNLLFSTEKGNKIHPGQIVRNMKKASQRAKLPIILSPKILYAHAKAYAEKIFLAMPENERKRISEEYLDEIKEVSEKLKNLFAE
jgi:site-specific recombinase XerD